MQCVVLLYKKLSLQIVAELHQINLLAILHVQQVPSAPLPFCLLED